MTQSTPFTLRPASAKDRPAPHLMPLDANIFTGPEFSDSVNLISQAFGKFVFQGSLLAYLTRRFGFPNTPSDPHKDLASYLLTTSRPDMLMRVTPHASDQSEFSFTFLVPGEVYNIILKWPARAMDAHRAAFPKWLEENNLIPDWMTQARKLAAKEGYCDPAEQFASVQQTIFMIDMKKRLPDQAASFETEIAWLKKVRDQYHSEHPEPGIDYRAADWRNWPDDDPMKPYAEAIETTAHEFFRPVWVRDMPIGPLGPINEEDALEQEDKLASRFGPTEEDFTAKVAGYPVGALANEDPKGFADLMSEVLRLGGGDAETGLAKAYNLLKDETP